MPFSFVFGLPSLYSKIMIDKRVKSVVAVSIAQSFLQLSSRPESDILTFYKDNTVKIIPVALAKDGMQLKPSLLYDGIQGKLIGSTLNLNHDYVKRSEPDKDTLKSYMVQEQKYNVFDIS